MLARTQAQPRAAVIWGQAASRPTQTCANCSLVFPCCARCRILDKVELSVDDSWVHQVQLCGWNMSTHHRRCRGVSRGRMAFRSKANLGLLCAAAAGPARDCSGLQCSPPPTLTAAAAPQRLPRARRPPADGLPGRASGGEGTRSQVNGAGLERECPPQMQVVLASVTWHICAALINTTQALCTAPPLSSN